MLEKLDRLLGLFTLDRTELTAPDIGRGLKLPKSTTYRLLRRITRLGFLDHDADSGRYRLGIRLASLGELACRSTPLQRAALPALQNVTQATGETAVLVVLSGDDGVIVESVPGAFEVGQLVGTHYPLHATASGKVLLAGQPEDTWNQYVREPLQSFTSATITSLPALEHELAGVRQQGYALGQGELRDDLVAVAAPVRNHRDDVIGALAVGYTNGHVPGKPKIDQLIDALRPAAAQVSRELGYPGA